MGLFENLYRTLHENNRPLMNLVLHHSQYRHECETEQQQREEAHGFSSLKASERHTDSSLFGSVRRRFTASKLRAQNSNTQTPTGSMLGSPSTSAATSHETKSKPRSMTMELKQSLSKDYATTNGKVSSMKVEISEPRKTSLQTRDKHRGDHHTGQMSAVC